MDAAGPDRLEANKALVRRIYADGYNGGDAGVFEECYRPDFVHHSKVIHDVPPGAAGEAASMRRFRQAIPDVTFTVLDQLAEGDRVATRLAIAGTPVADYGTVPAGAPWSVHALALFRILDGQVAEEWMFVDGGDG